nr:ph-response regulator protein pali/prr-5 [Quercus suber]
MLAIAAHFHSPSHSPRYLLALLILTIPTLLVTLLAFLVDILLFVPHLAWGGWIVLAATILVIASMVVTCAMRRTLVSRKARKKRIAENANMNGDEYYNNLNQHRLMADSGLPRADSPPPLSGSTAADKVGQQFATFEMKRPETVSQDGMAGRRSTDDRTPLNPTRDPSIRSNSTGRQAYTPGENVPPMPVAGMPAGPVRQASRDQYGNPIPSQSAPLYTDLPPPELRHQGSRGSLASNGSRGGAVRGRGGYGPPTRGYGSSPRGAYAPMRGGPGPRGGYRGQGPPPGWSARGRGGPPGGIAGRGGMPRPGPPPGYGSYGSQTRSGPSPTMDHRGLAMPLAQDEFIAGPMIGQAIEMDERTGASPAPEPQRAAQPPYRPYDRNGDEGGMMNLQQSDARGPQRTLSGESHLHSPTSLYSEHQSYPAQSRSPWQEDHRQNVSMPEPAVSPVLHHNPESFSSGLPSSQVMPQVSPVAAHQAPSVLSPHPPARGGPDTYYEDVDPRFAVDPASEVGALNHHENTVPYALTPGLGGYGARDRMPPSPQLLHPSSIPASYLAGASDPSRPTTDNSNSSRSIDDDPRHNMLSYDHTPPGARSPGDEGSETSHFTSVSQRGINPNWRGSSAGGGGSIAPGGAGYMSSASAAQRRREDVILNANPDFSLPGMTPGRGGAGGMRGGGGLGGGLGEVAGGPRPHHTRMGSAGLGLTPAGRYPTDI